MQSGKSSMMQCRSIVEIRYICGRIPCQSFSILGKRKGFEDEKERGIIYFKCLETIWYRSRSIYF